MVQALASVAVDLAGPVSDGQAIETTKIIFSVNSCTDLPQPRTWSAVVSVGANFVRAVVRLDAAVRSRFMRYALAQAGLATEPAYKRLATTAHTEFLAEHKDEWITAYRIIQDKCGVALRPGATPGKVFESIAWLVQAAAMEASVTGTDTSDLVAESIMTMITGVIDPGDHRSCKAFIDDMLSPGRVRIHG